MLESFDFETLALFAMHISKLKSAKKKSENGKKFVVCRVFFSTWFNICVIFVWRDSRMLCVRIHYGEKKVALFSYHKIMSFSLCSTHNIHAHATAAAAKWLTRDKL